MEKYFSIVKNNKNFPSPYFLRISIGEPRLEKSEALIAYLTLPLSGQPPEAEKVKEVFERLRQIARDRQINFVANLDKK